MSDIEICFKNCRNITSVANGSLRITENTLNIFFASNGTGKTTIVRICDYLSKRDSEEGRAAYETLRSFKSLSCPDDEKAKPIITRPDSSLKVAIFDENWVDKHCFKPDSLRDDVFHLFVETDEYKQLESERKRILGELQQVLYNDEIDRLITGFQSIKKGIGATSARGTLTAAAPYSKMTTKGSPLGSVPDNIMPVVKDLTPLERARWLTWHTKGAAFATRNQQRCPYCGTVDEHLVDACIAYDKSRPDTTTNSWLKTTTAFADNASLFNSESLSIAEAALSAESDPTTTDCSYFTDISKRTSEVADTLSSLKSIQLNGLIDVSSMQVDIQDALAKLQSESKIFSEEIQITIDRIITVLNEVSNNIEKSTAVIAKQNSIIESAVKNHEDEINTFLNEAGYNYIIDLEVNEKGLASLVLKDSDSDYPVLGSKDHLSYGERNAITLILFLYEALDANPDLIVLDDPVSSFDGDKRFALLYTLFSPRQRLLDSNLQNLTVALFTHDFLVVSDWLKVLKSTHGTSNIKAHFLRTDKSGQLLCKRIRSNSIANFKTATCKKIKECPNELSRLIYTRQLVELEKETDTSLKPAWDVLSSLFHKRGNATDRNENALEDQVLLSGYERIQEIMQLPFVYEEWYERVKKGSMYIVSCYEQDSSAYEKLQFVRLLLEGDDSLMQGDKTIMTRFADETYHIGGDYLYQLDPCDYQQVPNYVVAWCDEIVERYKQAHRYE